MKLLVWVSRYLDTRTARLIWLFFLSTEENADGDMWLGRGKWVGMDKLEWMLTGVVPRSSADCGGRAVTSVDWPVAGKGGWSRAG